MKGWRSTDFWAGLMFIAFGLGFVIVARDYSLGTAARMGPSYFPTVLGGALVLLGMAIGGRSFLAAGAAVPRLRLRPVLMVTLSVVLFALTLEVVGLIGASAILVFVSAAAGPEFTYRGTVVLWMVLALFSVAVFHLGLGLPIPIAPSTGLSFS